MLTLFIGIHLTLHAFDFSSFKETLYQYWNNIGTNINEHKKLYTLSAAVLAIGGASWWAYTRYKKTTLKKQPAPKIIPVTKQLPITAPLPVTETPSIAAPKLKPFEKQLIRDQVKKQLESYVSYINNSKNPTIVKANTVYSIKIPDNTYVDYIIGSLPVELAYRATITYSDKSKEYLRKYPSSINWSYIPTSTQTVILSLLEAQSPLLLNNKAFSVAFDDPLAEYCGTIYVQSPLDNKQRNFKIHFEPYNKKPDIFFIDPNNYQVDIDQTAALLQKIKLLAQSADFFSRNSTGFNAEYMQFLFSQTRNASFESASQQTSQPTISHEQLKQQAYNILGLTSVATQEQIKKQYRRLALQYHPDKNFGDKKAEEKFKEIQEAYELLTK